MPYQVTDKIVGLTDHADYPWCSTEDEFYNKVLCKDVSWPDFKQMLKEDLISKNMMSESDDIWENEFISKSFDEETQTFHRVRIFTDKEEFDHQYALSTAVDYTALQGDVLYNIIRLSQEEV